MFWQFKKYQIAFLIKWSLNFEQSTRANVTANKQCIPYKCNLDQLKLCANLGGIWSNYKMKLKTENDKGK